MSDEKLNDRIEPILRRRLEKFGFARSEVSPGRDHDGDLALFITVRYEEAARIPEEGPDLDAVADAVLDAVAEIRTALRSLGDERFPYLRHAFNNEVVEPAA